MAFELYFTVEEICQRIPRSAKFFRNEIQRGAFSPAGDLGNVLVVDGCYFVPASGVEHYLRAHGLSGLAELTAERLRPAVGARIFSNGSPARSRGELRRKVGTEAEGNG